MKRIFIIGATPFGRVLESWLEQSPDCGREWEIGGFLHSGTQNLDKFPTDYNVVGDWQDFEFVKGDMVIPGIASAVWKEKIFETVSGRAEFFTFIHPAAIICKFVEIGRGVAIGPHCIVGTHVSIGDGAMLNCGTQIGHDSIIGRFVSIMANVDLGGFCTIGDGSFMGTNSTLVPHKRIGKNCNISAGAVVMCNVRDGRTMGGNPAVSLN